MQLRRGKNVVVVLIEIKHAYVLYIGAPEPLSIFHPINIVWQPRRWRTFVWVSIVHVAQHHHSKFVLISLHILHLNWWVLLRWLGLSLLLWNMRLLLKGSNRRGLYKKIHKVHSKVHSMKLLGINISFFH